MVVKHVQHIVYDEATAIVYTGPEGELIVERGSFLIRVQDGSTPGGWPTMSEAAARAIFITTVDFETEIADIEAGLDAQQEANLSTLFGYVLISRGPVLGIATSEPGSPAVGDRYLVAHSATSGALVGQEDQVMEYTASGLQFSGAPDVGQEVFNSGDDKKYYFNGTLWDTVNPDETLEDRFVALETDKADLLDPIFTGNPRAPTPDPGDNDTSIATTAFVTDALNTQIGDLDFDNDLVTAGFQKLPNGLILQWCQGAVEAADGSQDDQTITWPIDFPTACLHAQVTMKVSAASNAIDCWYQVVSVSTSAVVVQRQHGEGGVYSGGTTQPWVFAMGF